jgi:hypothetical protein
MANLSGYVDYNASPESDRSPLPSGEYLSIISASDMKPTKNNSGEYLELEHTVVDGPFKGRKFWARLNLHNPNTTAVQIAQQHLAQIRHATGILNPTDSFQLHNIPMLVRVELVPASAKRDREGNEVREWKRVGQAPAAPQPAAPPPYAPQHAANAAGPAGAPAWAKPAA